MITESIDHQITVPFEYGNKRLDYVAAQVFPDYSRSKLQQWIQDGQLLVNGQTWRGRDKVVGGERLTLHAQLQVEGDWRATEMPINKVYEDEHILVINKPTDLVVHPAAGHHDDTLLNGLLFDIPELAHVPRAGIVHRLDKDTTGLMVVAKTLQAHTHLVAQLQDRSMGREYEAVVQGHLIGGGTVNEPIGRHGTQRTKMAVQPLSGKEAITHYRVLNKFPAHTHVRVKLETGRTHQIRVHLSHIGYPLVGDGTYAGRQRLPKGVSVALRDTLQQFNRQALHAKALGLFHPETEEWLSWEVDLPDDMIELLAQLDHDAHG